MTSKRRYAALGIILVSLIIFLASCVKHAEYRFEEKIGDEQVKFGIPRWKYEQFLRVERTDGIVIVYTDHYRDLTIDEITIYRGESKTVYYAFSKNPAVQGVINEGQKQFDEYLKKIHEINSSPLRK